MKSVRSANNEAGQSKSAQRRRVHEKALYDAKRLLACGVSSSIIVFAVPALAQESQPVPDISVTATPADGGPTSSGAEAGAPLIAPPTDTAPNPKSTISPEGIRILGGPAQSSSYKPLDLLPSVIEDSADPYGLSFTRSITVRGVTDFFMSKTINGLPVQGIVGGADLFDLEDLASINLYRGALLSNQGLGFSNAGGALDLILLAPKAKAGGFVSQGIGSDGFWRTFGRVDSGLLATGTAFFISGSITDADKWKGAGDARRENIAFGLTQALGDNLTLDLYGVHNYQKAYNYMPLTYAQTQNLATFAGLDYNTILTGVPSIDKNYYGYNYTEYNTNAMLGNLTYRIDRDESVSIKPYFWLNDGLQWTTSGSGAKLWPIDNYTVGVVAEYKKHFSWNGDLILGYWTESAKPEPPPLGQQQFNLNAKDVLTFANWAVLAKTDDHQFYSPYFQYTQALNATTVSGGLRLHVEEYPWMQYYVTKGLPGVSYSDIWSYNPKPDLNGAVVAHDFYEFLPNFGVRQQLTNEWSVNVAYGRKIGRPDWGPQASNFSSNEAAFLKHGITLQTLMGDLQPELVDSIDVGARYQSANLTVTPDLFAFKTHAKEVLVYDPIVGQNYYQSSATTTGYGFELEGSWMATEYLTFTGSFTAASETYDNNIVTASNAIMPIKGKQVPYAPKFQEKIAMTYHDKGLEVTPVLRFVSTRYGLADNSQAVSPYAVADITASYEIGSKLGFWPVKLTAGVLNVFNTSYIGAISVNEDNLSSTSYYAAPPRTIFARVSAQF